MPTSKPLQMPVSMRADQLLVEQGLAETRSQAQRLIAAGVSWRVGAGAFRPVVKNGEMLPSQAQLQVLDPAPTRYVSRGGLKLEGALQASGWSVTGWRCLDVGQSTGGFTDCLLQHGAAQVLGIDVGHGQLHPSLRSDARVQCIEGLNARQLRSDDARLGRAAAFDLVVGDVSFISLTLVLPAVLPWLAPGGHVLMLVKPQFELQPQLIGKGGVVRDSALYAQVKHRLQTACQALGLQVQAWHDSPILGGDGNREFFVQARKAAAIEGVAP